MASSLDNHPPPDGFCVRSSDGEEVLIMGEYFTLDDIAEEGDLQFEDGDVMVGVFGSDVYVDGVCADGIARDRSSVAGLVSEDSKPKLSLSRGDLDGSAEDFERRPQGLPSGAECVSEGSCVRVLEEGGAASDRSGFSVCDLVWVELEIHQWWPGQIADPSEDPSEKTASCSKKDLFLIAYFGDRSFSWHEASSLKPFVPSFSDAILHHNSEEFWNAVDCALVEFSTRVELGLACSCLAKNSHETMIQRNVVNGRTMKLSATRDGVDDFVSAQSFIPEKFLEHINLLARLPLGTVDKLELAVTKAQLLCIYRHNGHEQLPEAQDCQELMESGGGEGSSVQSSPLHKLRHNRNDISDLVRKETSLAELVGDPVKSLEEESPSQKKRRIQEPSISSCNEDRNKHISPAEEACRGQFTGSLASARIGNGESAQLNGFEVFVSDSGDIRFPEESSPDAWLEQIQFEATNALEVHEKPSEIYQPEDTSDSYWTDRIIKTNPQDQQCYNGGMPIHKLDRPASTVESPSSIDGDCMVVDENTPAELVLLFPSTGRFPCEVSLNKTLKMFGPLKESETRVDRKSRQSRVVFRKFGDAKAAFDSAQKYSIFGPVAVKYQLNCPISGSH
ncbi:hypothetical protein MLD38_038104 [Melastoma candidum]|uniref:Uncharacterized protein n=1 Tax=Melastoma candidum TaxID=119954 RepID=A0ACB9KZ06_9MYRT|nr:hypothetical protein MLD38_038104 [Melastoma candidum]